MQNARRSKGSMRFIPGTGRTGRSSARLSRLCRSRFSRRSRCPRPRRTSRCRPSHGRILPSFILIPAAPRKTGPSRISRRSPRRSRMWSGAFLGRLRTYTTSPAGSQRHAYISGTIPGSAIWPPPSGLRSLRFSSPPIPASGLPGATMSPSSTIPLPSRFSIAVRSMES